MTLHRALHIVFRGGFPPRTACFTLAVVCLLTLLCGAAGCGEASPEPSCVADASALDARLGTAGPGDSVRLCAGARIRGTFRLPGGVSLLGSADAILEAEGGAALRVEPSAGGPPTQVHGLAFRVGPAEDWTPSAVVVQGQGEAVLRDLDIALDAGVGVLAIDTGALRMEGITVRGSGAGSSTATGLSGQSPVAGVWLAGDTACAGAALDGVRVSGVAGVGIVAQRACPGRWSDIAVADVVGNGIVLAGGELVEIDGLLVQGVRGRPVVSSAAIAHGLVLVEGARVHLRHGGVLDTADGGILVGGAHLTLEGGMILGSRGAGVRVDGAAGAASLDATGLLIRGVAEAGLQVRAARVDLRQAWVDDVLPVAAMDAQGRLVWTGDGVRVHDGVQGQAGLRLEETLISAMARAAAVAAGAARLEGPSGGATVCEGAAESAEWTCAVLGNGDEQCERSTPPETEGWTCLFEDGALSCTARDPADPGVPVLPVAGVDEPRCAELRRRILAAPVLDAMLGGGSRPQLPLFAGIIGEDGTLGARPIDAAAGHVHADGGARWQCEGGAGAGRVCRLADAEAGAPVARFGPTGAVASGWSCATTAGGQVCNRRTLAGIPVGDEPVLLPETLDVPSAALAQRTERAVAADIALAFDRGASSTPVLPSPRQLATADGLLGAGRPGLVVAGPAGIEEVSR